MSKLIIDPELLRQIGAKADALPALAPPGDPNNNPDLDDVMPPRVAAFWNHQEPDTPPWRLESASEYAQREESQGRGCWTG
jgi:hypothetical protein